MSIAIALLLGYAMAYPNFPDSYITDLEQKIETGGAVEEVLALQTQLDCLLRQQEFWPIQLLGWAGISLALLLAMTATLYLPIRYRLDEKGVMVFFLGAPNFRRWSHYRNFYVHDTGIHLTTMPTPSALDPFRGHYLRFDNNSEEVAAYIKAHIVVEKLPG